MYPLIKAKGAGMKTVTSILSVIMMMSVLNGVAFAESDNVSKQIQLLNSQIQDQIQKVQSTGQDQVQQLNKQIQTQLKQMQTDLQNQIKDLNEKLEAQIKKVETSLQEQIKQVQQESQSAVKKTQ